VEIIQPLEGGSTYADFLDRNGPGIHHVAFRVANFDEVYASLTALGCPVLQEGCGMFRGRMVNMAYIDCTAIGGPVIELGEITESGSHAGAEPGVMEG
jgi:4-hydroxyphenylpyruvate dioxygenase-like putative hemolysin